MFKKFKDFKQDILNHPLLDDTVFEAEMDRSRAIGKERTARRKAVVQVTFRKARSATRRSA